MVLMVCWYHITNACSKHISQNSEVQYCLKSSILFSKFPFGHQVITPCYFICIASIYNSHNRMTSLKGLEYHGITAPQYSS
jgi:hypothetical protein